MEILFVNLIFGMKRLLAFSCFVVGWGAFWDGKFKYALPLIGF
jgi:hypothetical protein